jgi:peptide/nickel transport system substrate-binding protein
MRRMALAGIAAGLAIVMAGTTASTALSQTNAANSKTLRTAYQADIGSFDPDNNFEVAGLGAILAVYQGLVAYAPGTTHVVGALATRWTVSKDGLTYTFKLRTGVRFHDGAVMTSKDVLASFTRRQNQKFILSYFLWDAKKLSAPNLSTFVIKLGVPEPSLLDNLASAWGPKVVGPDALKAHAGKDLSATYLKEHADGTGPFTLATFQRGQQYVLKRFAKYWGRKAYFNQVQIKIVPDIGQQILQLRSGELDMVLHGYPFEQLKQLPSGFTTTGYSDLGLEQAYVNMSGVLKDPTLRMAVKAALNPKAWVADAFSGFATPAATLFPSSMLRPKSPIVWPTDIAAAKAAVSKVGNVDVKIVYTSEEAGVQQRVTDLMIAQLAKVGIKATARAVPLDQVRTYAKDPAGAPADLIVQQSNPDSAHPESHVTLFYTKGAPLNKFGFSDPKADAIFKTAGSITNLAKRNATYEKGVAVLWQDGAFLPLADVKDVIVHRSNLVDLGTRPAIPWNVDLGSIRES